nr:hypothetical protein [Rhodoferax sp.]
MSALLILVVGGLWGATPFFITYLFAFFIPQKGMRAAIGVVAMIGVENQLLPGAE